MKFFRILHDGRPRVGVVQQEDAILLPPQFTDVTDVIAGEGEARAIAHKLPLDAGAERIVLAQAKLLAPIGRFQRDVLCTGWTYWDHFEEGRGRREGQDVERPTAPTFFTKSPRAVIGPADDIAYDAKLSLQWDYEAELVVIFGRTGRSISRASAMDHVFGYCLANDVSQRDLQRRHGGQWMKGKSLDATMPLGPYIVTADDIDPAEVRLQCRLNGEVMQDASVRQMAFPIPELIEELSFGMTIGAGEILLTGTPAGVGNARTPQVFLKDGDVVEVEGTGLGELANRVTQTPAGQHNA